MLTPQEMDVLILAGGLGTRLKPISGDTQKCLTSIFDRPFLTYKLTQLRNFGFQRVILCVGYQSQEVQNYFERHPIEGLTIEYSNETERLGTAGAFKNAEHLIQSDTFIALNGDVYLDLDYELFVQHHFLNNAQASLALARAEDPSQYGMVMFNSGREIHTFVEKGDFEPASIPEAAFYINAGTYCLNRSVLDYIPEGESCSIETEVFPQLIDTGFIAYPVDDYFIDIGTPDRFMQIQQDILAGRVKLAS